MRLAQREVALAGLQNTMPEFVRTVIGHRPASLRGQALGDAVRMPGRTPGRLLAHYRRWAANPEGLRAAPLLYQGRLGHEALQLATQSIAQDDGEHRATSLLPR